MIKLFLYKNVYITIPKKHYNKIQSELDQILVLTSLLDLKIYSGLSEHNKEKFVTFYINELSLDIKMLNHTIQKINFYKVLPQNNGLFAATDIYTYNYQTKQNDPYKTLLKSLIYIKNAL